MLFGIRSPTISLILSSIRVREMLISLRLNLSARLVEEISASSPVESLSAENSSSRICSASVLHISKLIEFSTKVKSECSCGVSIMSSKSSEVVSFESSSKAAVVAKVT